MRTFRFHTSLPAIFFSATAVLLVGCGQTTETNSADQSEQPTSEPVAGPAENETMSVLAEIEIKAKPAVNVALLEAGTRRLSGKVGAKIEKVGKELAGASFTLVPWKKSVTYEISVTKPGYLYFMKGSKKEREKLKLTLEDLPKAVTGAFLQGAYRARVEDGQQITFGGYELSLIAARIEIVDSM